MLHVQPLAPPRHHVGLLLLAAGRWLPARFVPFQHFAAFLACLYALFLTRALLCCYIVLLCCIVMFCALKLLLYYSIFLLSTLSSSLSPSPSHRISPFLSLVLFVLSYMKYRPCLNCHFFLLSFFLFLFVDWLDAEHLVAKL